MDYLLDSNIIIIYSRDNELARKIEADYKIFSGDHRLGISTVSLGEINASIKKLQLGARRKKKIEQILEKINEFAINIEEVIGRYGDIDAFSQGQLAGSKGKFSARNMGKNDIWIAATASVFNLKLVTTDKDFEHLDGVYIDLEYISMQKYRNK